MRVRRWSYLVVLGVGALAATALLIGSASASAPPKPPPFPPPNPKSLSAPARAPHATAAAFTCGEVAITSITLTSDEDCSGSIGIYAGASGIIINLNGHTLSGDGTHDGVAVESFHNVTVENGMISDFGFGVAFDADSNRAVNLRVTNNLSAGIYVAGNSNVVSQNTGLANAIGVWINNGNGNQATLNWMDESTTYGLYVAGASATVISGNKAMNSVTGGSGTGFGIVAEGTGQVTGNTTNGNDAEGIFAYGFSTSGKPGLTVSKNRAAFNGGLGIENYMAGAVDGGGNVVQDNGATAQCKDIVCDEVGN